MEVWKDIKGYEGLYQVSNFGRVRSIDRYVSHPKSGMLYLKGRPMSLSIRNGYSVVSLNKNGKATSHLVHRLVAVAFIENIENKPQVNHKNGVKDDNNISNLEWVTASENSIHAYKKNLNQKGINHYKSKLTNDKVKAIKRLLSMKPNINKYSLAKKVGVTNGVIYQIINKTTWKHIN